MADLSNNPSEVVKGFLLIGMVILELINGIFFFISELNIVYLNCLRKLEAMLQALVFLLLSSSSTSSTVYWIANIFLLHKTSFFFDLVSSICC